MMTSLLLSCVIVLLQADEAVKHLDYQAQVDRVTLFFEGDAEVEYVIDVDLEPGVHDVAMTGLQKRSSSDFFRVVPPKGWQVRNVVWEDLPKVVEDGRAEIQKRIESLDMELSKKNIRLSGITSDLAFIQAMGIRTSADVTADAGTEQLNLESVRDQLDFIQSNREELNSQMFKMNEQIAELIKQRELLAKELKEYDSKVGTPVQAVITVDVPKGAAGAGEVRLISNEPSNHSTSWQPGYRMQLDTSESTVQVDMEAIITVKGVGEWNDVEVVLSTARIDEVLEPEVVFPVWVDIEKPAPPAPPAARSRGKVAMDSRVNESWDSAREGGGMFGASIEDSITVVNFTLPGRYTLNPSKDTQAIQMTEFTLPAEQVYSTAPVMGSSAVYLKSGLVNDSKYTLLAGEINLAVDGMFIGISQLSEEVPVNGKFNVWWGEVPSIEVERIALERDSSKTGLLGGGRRTTMSYRIELTNTGDTPVTVEVLDRYPVSRSGDIEVKLADVTPALVTTQKYLETMKPRGILEWMVPLGAKGESNASAVVSWEVRVSHSSKIKITPIPE